MPNHPNPGVLPDEEMPHASEGLWYRFRCGACEEFTDLEYDPRGIPVACEVCGYETLLEGDY